MGLAKILAPKCGAIPSPFVFTFNLQQCGRYQRVSYFGGKRVL